MPNAQHTPGPWEPHLNEWTMQWSARDTSGRVVARPETWFVAANVQEANARLIAAAPDLLAALRSISAMLPSDEGLGGHAPMTAFIAMSSRIRAAIAKATAT